MDLNKISFVSFQGIRNGIPYGTTKGMIYRAEYFRENVSKNTSMYVSFLSGYTGTADIKKISRVYWLITKSLSYINRFTFKFSSYILRNIQEKLFDLFFSLEIKEPTIIISTAYLNYTLRKNKAKGGFSIFLAGNPDDRDINELLNQEKIKHKVIFFDAYTYDKRIKKIGKSLDMFDKIITFSRITYDSYSKRIPKEKLSTINSHAIPNKLIFAPERLIKHNSLSFCFVAHPFWLKGLPYLLEAWSKIDNSEMVLRIAGNIDTHLQKVIDEKYSTLVNVEYLGWIKDLNEFFRTSHVAIIPSLLDAGPTTVGEAMYCGLPVIVSDGCGSSELVKEGINGFVVPSGNSDEIAEKIKWFISNQDMIELMGKEAKKTIDDLSKSDQNKKVADHILQVIKELQQQ